MTVVTILSPDDKYHYLVTLNVKLPNGSLGTTTAGQVLPVPIQTFDHVREVQNVLSEKWPDAQVLVTNVVLLSGPVDQRRYQPTRARSACEACDGW